MGRPAISPQEMSLKALIVYYTNHCKFNEISNLHNYELALRFANYDMMERKFNGSPIARQPMPAKFAQMSKAELLVYYHEQTEINDALNLAMSHIFINYNVITRRLTTADTRRTHDAYSSKTQINWATKNDAVVKQMFAAQQAKGKIDEDLHAEMMRRFPGAYDPKKRDWKYAFGAPTVQKKDEKHTSKSTKSARAHKTSSKTDINMFGVAEKRPSELDSYMELVRNLKKNFGDHYVKDKSIPDIDDFDEDFESEDLCNDTVNSSIEPQRTPITDVVEKDDPTPCVMTPKMVKLPQVSDGTPFVAEQHKSTEKNNTAYNNVTVNGIEVLSNHVDTELKTFMDGRILGVRGIATDETAYPKKTMWHLYPMIQGFTFFSGMEKYNGYHVYIKQVMELPGGEIRLTLSNNSYIMFGPQKFDRLSGGVRFIIKNQKTR